MHYNDGWADGFSYNITYWEVWKEPDLGNFLPFSDKFTAVRYLIDKNNHFEIVSNTPQQPSFEFSTSFKIKQNSVTLLYLTTDSGDLPPEGPKVARTRFGCVIPCIPESAATHVLSCTASSF